MPWCEQCSKYLAPSAMAADGTCPTCGRPAQGSPLTDERAVATEIDESTPWHFKLLVLSVIAYLAWRIVEIFI